MDIRESSGEGAERIYRFMLMFYPPAFRRRFGREMVRVFRDSYPSDSRHTSFAAQRDFWIWMIDDLLRSLPGEWRKALIRLNKIELPFRRWADSLVVPLIVLGALLVAGNLGATVVRDLSAPGTVGASAEAWNAASMLAAALGVAGALGGVSGLSAIIAARNRRAESWIKL